MLAEYAGVLILLLIAIIATSGMLAAQMWLAPRRRFERKLEPFECGETQIVSPRRRHAIKFYLVAILFVVFDVGAVFFYPWGATFRDTGGPGLIAMGLFTLPLVVGLAYVWVKGALEW